MTFSPRLIALDIDGTLFVPHPDTGLSDEFISPAVREAVDKAVDAGIHVVLASGRSAFSMATVAEMLGLPRGANSRGLGVASNGAIVYCHPPLQVLSEIKFDASAAVRAVLEHVPDAMVAVEEHGVGYKMNRYFPAGELDGEHTIVPLDELVAEPVSRVIIRDPQSSPEDFTAIAAEVGLQGTNYFIGWTAWLDIAPEGITKASGLAQVATQLGVDQGDVLAIGDGRNDIEMLQWAGRGVAMAQGPDEVKAIADDVVPSVEEDGCAVEILRWL